MRMIQALVVVGLCTACSKEPPAVTPAAPVKVEQAKADPVATSPEKRLALQRLPGTTAVDRAVDLAQAAVRRNPANFDLWISLGHTWVRKAREANDPGFYVNAKACADVVLRELPENKLAQNLQALVLLNNHEFEAARTLARKIIDRNADDAMAYGSLSDAELELGLYDDAARDAQTMVDLKPNLPSYSRASHLAWLRGDVRGATESVKRAIDAGRDTKNREPRAWVLVQAATIFLHQGDLEGGDAGFDMALAWLPEFAPALAGKGRIALARKDAVKAVDYLGRSYKESPLVETAWLLGDARAMKGDKAGAEEMYAKVRSDGRKTDPRTLSLFLSSRGEAPDEALRLAEEEYRVRKDVYTEDAVAWAQYRAGKIEDARARIAKARRLGTPDPRLMYHEGAIRMAAGDKQGRKLVEQALAARSGEGWTVEATALLEQASKASKG
jgi:tetratricopeptide (TPR) repeat protein